MRFGVRHFSLFSFPAPPWYFGPLPAAFPAVNLVLHGSSKPATGSSLADGMSPLLARCTVRTWHGLLTGTTSVPSSPLTVATDIPAANPPTTDPTIYPTSHLKFEIVCSLRRPVELRGIVKGGSSRPEQKTCASKTQTQICFLGVRMCSCLHQGKISEPEHVAKPCTRG